MLREVGESFLNYQVVAKREAEQRAELAAVPDVVAAVPYFDPTSTTWAACWRSAAPSGAETWA